jgi:pimeloyl-ACP methyl ester carboxylesterase
LVHGIGRNHLGKDARSQWMSALVKGATAVGQHDFAAQLENGDIPAHLAIYSDLFEPADQQGGPQDLPPEVAALVAAMLHEMIGAMRSRSRDGRVAEILEHAQAQLRVAEDTEQQGVFAPVRVLTNVATTLLSIPGLGELGRWLTAKAMVFDLAQVARYLSRSEADASGLTLDQRIRDRVAQALGPDPAIVVAHSLGSIVAFETLHELHRRVPLLVTLGSPLALRTAVWPRLRPQPPATPDGVGDWLNFWDRDDIVAARPRLERVFAPNAAGIGPKTERIGLSGVWTHAVVRYLARPEVARPIARAASAWMRRS